MHTTVTIDDELLSQARVIAARTHRTIDSVLEDALRKLIADQSVATGDRGFALADFSYSELGLKRGVDLFDREQVADLQGDNSIG